MKNKADYSLQYTKITILLIMIVGMLIFFGISVAEACGVIPKIEYPDKSQANKESVASIYTTHNFDTITIKTDDRDVELRVDSISEMYDKSGNMSYRVMFKTMADDFRFISLIPVEVIESIDKDAVYAGTLEVAYLEEMVDKAKKSGSLPIPFNDYRTITGIDFMFSEYTKTTSVEEFEEQMIEKYSKLNGENKTY